MKEIDEKLERKLTNLIDDYGITKDEQALIKKITDESNKIIKELMSENELDSFTGSKYKASYKVVVQESIDEDKFVTGLIHLAETDQHWSDILDQYKIVKMRPYIDMDALESAIYDGMIEASVVNQYKVTKEIPRLTVTKLKEKSE